MEECVGKYYLVENQLLRTVTFDKNMLLTGISFYEVIRVMDLRCLFLEDHIARLNESLCLSGFHYNQAVQSFYSMISSLIACNKLHTGNIKLVIHFPEIGQPVRLAYFIPHHYPSPEDYKNGVQVALFKAARTDPNIKRSDTELRCQINGFIAQKEVFEALLVNQQGMVTEGSKSNVFFIQGKSIYTAPDETVLKGITRQYVIKIINNLNYNLITSSPAIIDLIKFNSAFLTGTSLKVLPVKGIDNLLMDVTNPILRVIMKAYDKEVDEYLNSQSGK